MFFILPTRGSQRCTVRTQTGGHMAKGGTKKEKKEEERKGQKPTAKTNGKKGH